MIQRGTIKPSIKKPMTQIALLCFSIPTSLLQVLQNAIFLYRFNFWNYIIND